MDSQFCTVEEALEELRAGHLIITIDDPDRENEGDLICAAQFATTENVIKRRRSFCGTFFVVQYNKKIYHEV